jgi:hypothetical protein
MSQLIPVGDWRSTALAPLSCATVYDLCRRGVLPCVRVGRRVFLTQDGIARFIAAGGAGEPIKLQRKPGEAA